MKRVLKWLGIGAGGLVVLAALAAMAIYVLSEREIRRQYTEIPLAGIAVPHGMEAIAEGKRLATIYGCLNCHGKDLQGTKLFDDPAIARINAPNLTRVVREYDDAQLERLIRHGVKIDGTSTWLMPSPMFSHMSDEDLGNVIAFLRSVPERGAPMRDVTIRYMGRVGIVAGKFRPLASTIDPALPHAANTDHSDRVEFGRYLVMNTCTECHGQNLQGDDFLKSPNLAVTAGYSDAAFRRLLRTGIAIGGRRLGLMTEAGEARFPSLTEEEMDAIQAYLAQRFGNPTLAHEPADASPTAAAQVGAAPADRS